MRNFNNDRGFKNFGGSSFGGNRGGFSSNRGGFGGGRNERPTMYSAVCDKCGRDCEVPFRPSGEKPVYCSNCFEKTSGRDGERDNNRGFEERRPRENNFRNENSRNETPRNEISYKSDFEALNKKLDRLLDLLIANKETKEVEKPAKAKKVAKKVEVIEVPVETQE